MAESEGNQISLLLNRYFSKNKKETRAQICKLGQQRLTFFRTKGHNRGNKTWKKYSNYFENKQSRCHDVTITETHLFFFFKSSSIWQAKIFCDYGFSTDIFTHTVEHTQFLWVLGTIQMVAWSKKGRARAKQKGKADAITLLAKLQLKQYHWQRQGKMGNYGRGKKKINPPHTPASNRCCGWGEG